MKKNNNKKLLIIIACILAIVGTLLGIFYPNEPINNTIAEYQNYIKDEIVAIDENILVEDITENEEDSSNKNTIEEVTIKDEKQLENEFLTEEESFELQGDISYDGNGDRFGLTVTGKPQLTYISQVDLRWKDYPYTSINSKSQTIGSSGCGVASTTMVVDAIVGQVDIRDVADTFVRCGYRSPNNGTYWSAYRAVADEFNIGYTETTDIQKALDLLRSKNYVIVSCGNGLFTTGGHYIVIVGIEGNTFKIYDPYLYNGKFDISTRRGKVVVSGNTVYCSIENFKRYANYKGFFCYQDIDHINTEESKYKAGQRVLVNVPVGIAVNSGEKWLVDDGKTQFWIHKSVITNDNRIYGLADICYDGGIRDIVQIFNDQFWCNENNMSTVQKVISSTQQIKNTIGNIKTLKQSSVIYENNNLTGKQYNYRINTKVKILKNITENIDYIQVIRTGRKGYLENNLYK